MTPTEKTSVTVKASTRKRIKYIAETKAMDYDELINWLLDELRFPTWEDVQTAISQRPPALATTGGN